MSMREEFEAFIYEHTRAEIHKKTSGFPEEALETVVREIALVRNGDGYKPQRTQEWWAVWSASRAALTVKLGKRWSNQDGDWFEDEDGDSLDYSETVRAIEAAGVQVKP